MPPTMENTDLMKREMEIEDEALTSGIHAYRRRVQSLEQNGLASKTDYGKHMVANCIQPLADEIVAFLAVADTKPGRKHLAGHALRLVDPCVAALLACRTVFDGIGSQARLQAVALGIGHRIEDEVRFAGFQKENKPLFLGVKRNLAKHPMGYQEVVRRSMLVHAANKFKIAWQHWETKDRLHVGMKLIELFMVSSEKAFGTPMVQETTSFERKHDSWKYLVPTEATNAWLQEYKAHHEMMHPMYMPMLVPPRPWTGLRSGGYYHERFKPLLVKVRVKGAVREIAAQDMPEVYRAVNTLQAVPWKVNVPMLDLVHELLDSGVPVKGVPAREKLPVPPKPADYDLNLEARCQWKKRAGDLFRAELRNDSKRVQVAKVMFLADKFRQEAAIYFPVQLDFRGRIYTLPSNLNPQSSDLAKALLTFAQGKPLGPEGALWLAVHLANCFGFDKCSLSERVQWTLEHSDRIEACANDHLGERWWTEADKPFQFLAAAVEWVGYLRDGRNDYVCSLPIMVDGSCNGLQHFSAMLRDEVCGRHVNLVPQDKPADIYQAVADRMMEQLQQDSSPYAKPWLEFGINRKMAKRPVMVLPYGGTRNAFADYLREAVAERLEAGEKLAVDNLSKALQYLTNVLVKAMDDVVVGPRTAMKWLQECSRVISRRGLPLVWTTPSGFLVYQRYPEMQSSRVETKLGDRVIKLSLNEETRRLDKRRQSSGVAPNFVHSLDASALVLTINSATDLGLTHLAAIHDSYGTLAADMGVLSRTLRRRFVEMYESCDVLAKFAQEVTPEGMELSSVPAKGTLDLAGVLASDFFFA